MVRYSIISLVFLVGVTSAVHATTCTGKWGGKVDTSVEFKQGGKSKYCFAKDCWTQKIFQNGKDFLFLVGGASDASVELKASGKGFNATWRSGSKSAKAKLVCK